MTSRPGRGSRERRLLVLAPVAAGLVAAACSSGDDRGPAPNDPVVFDASAETTSELGIAKWGFDDGSGTAVYHGYDAKNARVLELRQSLEQVDSLTRRLTLTMTGSLGEAHATIDVGVVVSADFQTASYTQTEIENTFATGVPGKVLAHLAPDSLAMAQNGTSTGSLGLSGIAKTQSLATRDLIVGDAGALVGDSGSTVDGGAALADGGVELIECCCELTNSVAALQAAAGSSCALVTTPADGGAALVGQSLAPRALVRENGRIAVKSPWTGAYNIVDHHCHNAAAQNSSATDGYVGCTGDSSTTSFSGHTINWAPNPYQSANNYCAYEPQANGGTISDGAVCCFRDGTGTSGAPALSSADARTCINQLCLGQADFSGATPPQAFGAGSKPPLPNDCPATTTSLASCNTCCTDLATRIGGYFTDPDSQKQVSEYRTRCAANCRQAETVRTPSSADNPCAAAVLRLLQSKADKSGSCAGSGAADGGAH